VARAEGEGSLNLPDLYAEMIRLSGLLDDALNYLGRQTKEFAEAEADYRHAKARAWVEAPKGTVPEREAWVNGVTADQRKRRDLADGMRQAGLEAVRSRRAQLSALQTISNAHREEAALARTGPEMAA
jgi:hypothetical protein